MLSSVFLDSQSSGELRVEFFFSHVSQVVDVLLDIRVDQVMFLDHLVVLFEGLESKSHVLFGRIGPAESHKKIHESLLVFIMHAFSIEKQVLVLGIS